MDALVENERLSTLVKHQKIPTKSFDDLPEEVLLKICAYLSLQSLIRCSAVSKRARRVCHDELLWQKINLYGKEVPSEFIKQTLANGCTYLSLQEAQIKGTLALPYKKYHLKNMSAPKPQQKLFRLNDAPRWRYQKYHLKNVSGSRQY